MKDTIGAHVSRALSHARINARLTLEAQDAYRFSLTEHGDALEIQSAYHEGAAAGHAFRAAELAYDMGAMHQRVINGTEPFL